MIEWDIVYKRVMSDFQGQELWKHLGILLSFIVLGIVVGLVMYKSFIVMFLFWIIGALIDYLAYGQELLDLFSLEHPYVLQGVIQKKIQVQVQEDKGDFEEWVFLIDVKRAHELTKQGKNEVNYPDREGLQRIGVPESMFLSLQTDTRVYLVCEPDDMVWGIVNGDEVIRIEE